MINLQPQVVLGGTNYSAYVTSISRRHSLCDTMSTATVEFASNMPNDPTVYDTAVIHEQGTKVFTGYVTNVDIGRMPISYIVEISDPSIKLVDYWLDQIYESTGETAEYWIGFFCDLAGVSYTFDTTYNRIVPSNANDDGISWEYSSAMDVIRELLVIGGFYMYSDAEGLIHFGDQFSGTAPENIASGSNMLNFHRDTTIEPTRNKAIVFGKYPISAVATITISELDDRIKTAVVATRYVETLSYAQDLADKMITYFAVLGDTKQVQVLPNPEYHIGQEVSISESWSSYSKSNSLITTVESRMDNSGYVMTLTLDEFCPFIWGYSITVAITLYAGTDGQGVWKSTNLGLTWTNVTGNIPSGDSRYVRGISANADVVWAATRSGVYYTSVGGNTWSNKTPTLPAGVVVTDWTDVEMDPISSGVVYILMDDVTDGQVFLHKTTNNGLTWTNVEIV